MLSEPNLSHIINKTFNFFVYNITVLNFLFKVSGTFQGGDWRGMMTFDFSVMRGHRVYLSGKKALVCLFAAHKKNRNPTRGGGHFEMGRKRWGGVGC